MTKTPPAPPRFYTTDEIAGILHLHVKTVRDMIQEKKLKAIRVGNEYRVSDDHLMQFIKENETFGNDNGKTQ